MFNSTMSNPPINIIYENAGSLKRDLGECRTLLDRQQAYGALLCETFLSSDSNLRVSGYAIHRNDRRKRIILPKGWYCDFCKDEHSTFANPLLGSKFYR